MGYETLLVEKQNSIATVKFNRLEKMNAASPQVFRDLYAALDDLNNDPEVKVLVLTGQEKAFSAGADLGHLDFYNNPRVGFDFIKLVTKAFRQFEEIDKPVIGAVNGYAFGFGTEITLVCDIAFASEQAKFGLKEVTHGAVPVVALSRGKSVMLKHHLAYIAMTGETLTAQEAKEAGLVSKVLPHDQLLPETYRVAERIAQNGPMALEYIKRMLTTGTDADYRRSIEVCTGIFVTEDLKEGRAAFQDRRKAEFKGR